ncbi:uncharacterized protein LOC110019605 [Phalaenopsis equestris]|uniref:uncharacterized protein LOC110019605 n=1 Tax=Phalaenopsis equestris TaxID=78828 RepID=UPI0009E2275E|nr:uncharacterized protein LOC110019605 [Phalaenopsis equestris]
MANTPLSLLLLSATALIFTVAAGYAGGEGSIHDLLREHGLPAGLLPKSVESYTLDSATGILEVRLDRPCFAKYDGLAFFDQVVRGNLSYGALGSVSGLKQEELFLWLPVRGILLSNPSSGVILFDIGVAHKQLSLSLFEVPPDCRPAEGAEVAIGGIREIPKGLLGRRGGFQDQR